MPVKLQDALARALGDPSLRLAYWLPEFESWADLDGRPVALPERDGTRATTLIDRDGQHPATLVHDPSLGDEPKPLDAVSAAAGMALENGRRARRAGGVGRWRRGSRSTARPARPRPSPSCSSSRRF